jgi:hypothetical protein
MDFLRFYITTSRLQLDADCPTQDSITTVAEWFFAGFTRITGTDILTEEREAVYIVSTLETPYDLWLAHADLRSGYKPSSFKKG